MHAELVAVNGVKKLLLGHQIESSFDSFGIIECSAFNFVKNGSQSHKKCGLEQRYAAAASVAYNSCGCIIDFVMYPLSN